MPFSDHFADRFIAPELSRFKAAEIRDMSGVFAGSEHWLGNYILNGAMRGDVPSPEREFRFNVLRRAVEAVTEHALARAETLRFLASEPRGHLTYFVALRHWEHTLAAMWHGLHSLAHLAGERQVFEKGDDSPAEHLNALYNAMKHVESRVASGQMPDLGPLPVWLCDEGLRSTDEFMSFAEISDVLEELAGWAHVLEDPISSAERLREWRST